MDLQYAKGHMGGNRIVLLDGRRLSDARALHLALTALAPEWGHGHQAGLISPGSEPGHIRARVVSISWRDFIPACGGLTQVLGHALALPEIRTWAGLAARLRGSAWPEPSPFDLVIDFDAYPVPLRIHHEAGRVTEVESDLTAFALACQGRGPHQAGANRGGEAPRGVPHALDLDGVHAWRASSFLLLDARQVRRLDPDADVDALDARARQRLVEIQRRFAEAIGHTTWDFCLYDWDADAGRDLRVVFPHALPVDHVEPACGTGSTALAIALAASGELRARGLVGPGGRATLRTASGGGPFLGGPQTTTVSLQLSGERVERARFVHSHVTLTARGTLRTPEPERL